MDKHVPEGKEPKMKTKPSSKLILAIAFCFLLILEDSFVLGVKNQFPQSMKTEASLSQESMPHEIHKQMSSLESAEERTAPCSTFEGNRDFDEANGWADFTEADTNSAELIIGVSHTRTSDYDELANIIRTHEGKIVNTVLMGGKTEAVVADMPLASISSFTIEINAAGLSAYIEPNFKFKANFIPNDPCWNQQWAPIKIGADCAWDRQIGNSSVLVAVIDTGVDWNHPDLAANYVPLGYDWVNNDTDPMDDHGHGTHCAGIIAASINNSVGIAGLAQVRIMAEKGLDQHGEGYDDDLANAIIHAVDQGANILSNSWGGYEESALLHDAIKYAYEKGVLVVAAAGNDARDVKLFPAGYDEVIAVTATNESDYPASFTNFGEWVELAAPGVNIYSTVYDDSYTYMSGTSMACPHVSGVAALVWSQFPNATRDWVRLWLRYTADDLGGPGFDVYYGYGRINAEKAIGEPPDHELLLLDLEAPWYVEPGSVGNLNTTVFNFGKSDEANLTVQLFANGSLVDSVNVDFLAGGVSTTVNFSWNPIIKGNYNITSYVVPVPGEDNISNNGKSARVRVYRPEVALFENVEPWGYSSNEEALDLYDVPYAALSSKDFESVNLSQFVKVVIASDQDQAFYDAMNASRWWFEDYVRNGGVLEIHAADRGWHGGQWIGSLPGELQWEIHETNYVTIVNHTHPVVNTPNSITDKELGGWSWSTHGYFSSYPDNSRVVIADSSGRPVYLEFKYEAGLIMVSGQTLEWAYHHAYSSMLENSLLNPVYRYKHELVAFLDAPIFLLPGNSSLLNATVMNYGSSNETNVNLQILMDGGTVDSVTIPELATDTFYTLTYLWTSTEEGIYNITAYTPPLFEEEVTLNNGASEIVRVRHTKHVLFDQTHGTDNIACYSEWIKALSERGFVVYTHATGAITFDELDNYDVFVIPQADSSYSPSEISVIQSFVFDGGGLLVIGDNTPSIYTNLTSFAGITWTSCEGSGITTDITPHSVTAEVASVYLSSALAKMNVSNAAQDIVRLDGDVMLTVSVQSLGKVIGFADENSLWDLGIGAADNLQLANDMIEWLATPVQYEHEISVKIEAPTHLGVNSSISLNATVCNRGINNETNVQLLILINGTVADSIMISELLVDSSYTLSYKWTPIIDGVYNATAYSPSMPDENNTANNVVSKMVRVGCADVALISTSPSLTEIYVGLTVNIAVVAENQGNFTETFSVIVYANATVISVEAVTNLAPSDQTTLILYWNSSGFALGDYAISAYAEPVSGEMDMEDNDCPGGWILIAKVGDLGGGPPPTFYTPDGVVDSWDYALWKACYDGTAPPNAMYLGDLGCGPPPTFFACDGSVDAFDFALWKACYDGLGPDT
jgi:thermitase